MGDNCPTGLESKGCHSLCQVAACRWQQLGENMAKFPVAQTVVWQGDMRYSSSEVKEEHSSCLGWHSLIQC